VRISEETLMAFVDGELDPGTRAEVEQLLRTDPELAAHVERQRNLRARLQSAYAPELAEPVPERLLAALREPVSAPVTDLEEARAARQAAPTRGHWTSRRWRWASSMAAGVLLAVGVGFLLWRNSQLIMIRASDGALVASGALSRSLFNQLAGDSPSASKVTVGLSFVAKSGDYCRTFSIEHGTQGSGLACHRKGEWRIEVLSQPESAAQGELSQYRTAGSSLAPAVLSAVQGQIAGEPLDRTAEIAARARGWRANPNP